MQIGLGPLVWVVAKPAFSSGRNSSTSTLSNGAALVFVTVFWGMRGGAAFGATFGFMIGLCADLDAAHSLGRHALGLSLIGYLVGRLSGTLVRDSVPTQLLLLIAATAVHQAWSIAFEMGGLLSWQEVLLRVVLGAFATGVTGAAILAFSKGWMSPRVVT
jgi:rod shape-determining protein MreD